MGTTANAAARLVAAMEQPEPFNESNLESAEYRQRLMRKLNCLIAVLEVANAKVRRSLAGPDPDIERLMRIKKNLNDTLEVCLRARTALEKRGSLPAGLSDDLARTVNPSILREGNEIQDPAREVERPPRGQQVEMSSVEEAKKFEGLGKIEANEIDGCDFDELSRQLQS